MAQLKQYAYDRRYVKNMKGMQENQTYIYM